MRQGQQEEKIAKKKAEKAEKALNPEPPKEEPSAGESLDDLVVECSTCSVQFAWNQLAEGHQGLLTVPPETVLENLRHDLRIFHDFRP